MQAPMYPNPTTATVLTWEPIRLLWNADRATGGPGERALPRGQIGLDVTQDRVGSVTIGHDRRRHGPGDRQCVVVPPDADLSGGIVQAPDLVDKVRVVFESLQTVGEPHGDVELPM